MKSTQKSLGNIIKIQGETICSRQQKTLLFESKFLSLEELQCNDNPQLNNQSMNALKDNFTVHSSGKFYESSASDELKKNQPYENCKTVCISPERSPNVISNIPNQPASDVDLLLKSSVNLQANVRILPVGIANLPPCGTQAPK